MGPGLQFYPVSSPPSLSPLGLLCSPDQGKLCLGIVFPTVSSVLPVDDSALSHQEAEGQGGGGQGEKGQGRGPQFQPWLPRCLIDEV